MYIWTGVSRDQGTSSVRVLRHEPDEPDRDTGGNSDTVRVQYTDSPV